MLIALFFSGLGVMAGRGSWGFLARLIETYRWVQTPAQILAAELQTRRHPRGGLIYQPKARYSYSWSGQIYFSEQIQLDTLSDRSPESLEPIVTRLQHYKQTQEACPCFVNPESPGQAILLRERNWLKPTFLLLFPLVFFTFAAVMLRKAWRLGVT